MTTQIPELPEMSDAWLASAGLSRERWEQIRAQMRAREAHAPAIGDRAPDFDLPYLGGDGARVRLSSFQGRRPVALIFGSYT
jgi:hypothetical protein